MELFVQNTMMMQPGALFCMMFCGAKKRKTDKKATD